MIPKKFTLLNRTYTVGHMPAELIEKRLGDCTRTLGKVRLAPTVQNRESLEHTFFHELVHAMLDSTTKPKLTDNEAFVDSLSGVLHQYMQTKKGEFK